VPTGSGVNHGFMFGDNTIVPDFANVHNEENQGNQQHQGDSEVDSD
jgi:hypothetical protein